MRLLALTLIGTLAIASTGYGQQEQAALDKISQNINEWQRYQEWLQLWKESDSVVAEIMGDRFDEEIAAANASILELSKYLDEAYRTSLGSGWWISQQYLDDQTQYAGRGSTAFDASMQRIVDEAGIPGPTLEERWEEFAEYMDEEILDDLVECMSEFVGSCDIYYARAELLYNITADATYSNAAEQLQQWYQVVGWEWWSIIDDPPDSPLVDIVAGHDHDDYERIRDALDHCRHYSYLMSLLRTELDDHQEADGMLWPFWNSPWGLPDPDTSNPWASWWDDVLYLDSGFIV